MKEQYLNNGSIELLLEKYRRSQIDKKQNKIQFIPQKCALAVLDMQRYFLENNSHAYVPSSSFIIPHINKLMNAFCQNKRPVIITKHENTPTNAGMMGQWWQELMLQSSRTEITSDLTIQPETIVLSKTQYDAFYNTSLEDILHKYNCEQIVVTGILTHLCVETTARSAFVRGFSVIVPADATATYNLDFHSSSLRSLSHGFAEITNADILCQTLSKYAETS